MKSTPERAAELREPDAVHWAGDPNHPRFKAAMRKTCKICHAKPDRPCWNTIDDAAPLPGRLIHIGRIEITV